jgi:hypothetical protein
MSTLRVVSESLTSRILAAEGEEPRRRISVLLPGDYDASERAYPVLYLLHGAWGSGWTDDRLWFGGAYRGSEVRYDVRPLAERAWREGDAGPFLVVAPDMNRRPPRLPITCHFPATASHLADEVVPLVDARYRTIRGRAARGIAGHSDGGTGAFFTAMLRPDAFGFAASLDGFGWIAEEDVHAVLAGSDARRLPIAAWLLGMTEGNGVATGAAREGRRALTAMGTPPVVVERAGDHYAIGPGLEELMAVFARWCAARCEDGPDAPAAGAGRTGRGRKRPL